MNSLDIASISVTSSFLAISFAHVLKEFISSLRIGYEEVTTMERERSNEVKNTLSNRIYRLLLYHVGTNNLTLLVLLAVVCGIISSITTNHMSTVCFLVGALVSVVSGFLAMYVCKRTSSKLVALSHRGLREVYKRCLGNSSAIVVLSFGLNCLALFVLTLVFTGNEEETSEDVLSVLKMLSFFAFGTLFVTLFSRLSGGLFTNSCSILLECNLEDRDQYKTLFENMNNYLQNIYELVLEVLAMLATLFCTYYMVMGQYTEGDKLFGSSFSYLNFPLLLMAFSMFVSVLFVTLFSLCMKNNTLKKVKNSYTYSTICSLVVVFAMLPLFHAYFLPDSLKEVKYGRYVNYGLVTLGLLCGMLIAMSNQYFLSSYNAPGKSVTLSAVTSLTGGIVNSLSYAKVLCFVPTAVVCLNLLICLLLSDFYGLLFVCIGFMCSATVVVTGSVFYSLIFTSSHLAEYSEDTSDVTDMFKSLKSSWHTINTITRPFLGTWCVMMGLVLLSHLSKKLEVKNYSYLNPYVLISLLVGALFPVFESGLILRLSSGIANSRLKKSSYSELMDKLYVDYKRKDSGSDDSSDSSDGNHRNFAKDYANKFMGMFKNNKNESRDTQNSYDSTYQNNFNASNHADGSNLEHDSEFNRDSSQYDNYSLFNYNKKNNTNNNENNNEEEDEPGNNNPDVIIEIESEREENYKKFGGAFKAHLLKEAGVKEELLLNAPITCSSARSTHEHYLIDNYYNTNNLNRHNYQNVNQNNPEDLENYLEDESENKRNNSNEYRHHSRDYRILKNADHHYKLFHPKYHSKHFNLRKRSTVASGNLEELQALLPLDKNDRREDEDDLTLAYEEEQALYESNNEENKVEETQEPEQVDQNNEEHKEESNNNNNNKELNNDNKNNKNDYYKKLDFEKLGKLAEKYLGHKSGKDKNKQEEKEENGDHLDQVVRRSQNMDNLVVGNADFMYDRSSSCGSTYRESETTSLLKVVHTNEVHTKEPNFDDDNTDNNTNNDNKDKEKTEQNKNTEKENKNKPPKPKSRSSDEFDKSSEGEENQPKASTKSTKPKKKKKKKRISDESTEGTVGKEKDLKPTDPNPGELNKPKKKRSAKKANDSNDKETSKDKTKFKQNRPTMSSQSSDEGLEKFKTSLVERAFALRQQRETSLVQSEETQEAESDENQRKSSEDNQAPFTINVQQALIPPDVGISNQPRRPTPKNIELPDFKDLEANRPEFAEVQPQNSLLGTAKKSAYQNTFVSLLMSLIPLLVALGFPYLLGVVLGKNSVLVAVLFSTISSSILVQVLTFCSMSWEATLHFIRVKKIENKLGNRSSVVNEIDVENGHTCRKIGKIASSSVGPVMNALILTLPLVCLFGTDIFNRFSNDHGFPSWTDYES